MVSKDVDSQSRELVEATMNSTAALFVASNTAVMTDNSLIMSSNIVASTMRNAIKVDIPIKAILVYNDMIDNCIDLTISKSSIDQEVKSSIKSMYDNYINTIAMKGLNSSSSSSSSSGSNNITITSPNMQLVVTKIGLLNTISSLSSQPPHQVSIISSSLNSTQSSLYNKNIPIVLSVTRSSLYDTVDSPPVITSNEPYYKIISNPLRLQVDCSLLNATKMEMTLYQYQSQLYSPLLPVTKPVVTTCQRFNKVKYSYMCEYEDYSTYNMTVACDGSKKATYTTECPSRLRSPSCGVISEKGKCEVLSFSNDRITCLCDICTADDMKKRRRLSSASNAVYVIAGMAELIYDDHVSATTSTSFSLDTLQKSIIVLVTFAMAWSIIIMTVPIKMIAHYNIKRLTNTSKKKLNVVA
jgi:hypothetical protein